MAFYYRTATDDVRCAWGFRLRDGTTVQCRRGAAEGEMCRQHAKMVAKGQTPPDYYPRRDEDAK